MLAETGEPTKRSRDRPAVVFFGDGEMAARMRALDWRSTPLGDPGAWPQSLRTLVCLMLASRQPMFIAWGDAKTWLYNDAFVPILGGKHPHALARPALDDVWREARPVLAPMFDRVFAGESIEMQDFAVELDRYGVLEEAHFSFSYTPARDDAGDLAGLFGACIETTQRVLAERRLAAAFARSTEAPASADDALLELRRKEEQLRLATEAAEIGLWDVDPVTDTLFWPPRVKAMFGISADVPVSMADFYAGLHPEDRAATSRAYAAAADPAVRALYDVEYRTVGKEDARIRWVAAKGRGIFDEAGRCVRMIGTAIDITARKEAEARLRAREEHLEAVVETSPECVKIVARDGTLLQMNRSGLAMIGAEREGSVVGRCLYDLIAPEHREAFRAFNERVCDGARETMEFDVVGLAGVRRHMESHGVPLRMPDGQVAQLALTRDVTARRAAQDALRESDRRKDEFIATLSHELRNPLAPLTSAVQVARMSDTPGSELAGMHEMMERQLNHLVRLVDDLLEVSRITHGAVELRRELVTLRAVVRQAVDTSRPVIDAASHELVATLPDEDVWLEGDPVRLTQIVSNLLNNAARYMPHGGRIEVFARADARSVQLAVRDRGSGFESSAVAGYFQMFGRGPQSSGLGIGLALARRLAGLHGGTIDATSEGPGKGAEFTLRLPRAAPPAQPAAAEAKPLSLAGRRILVVDDNRDAAESLRMMLELLGAEVHVAYDGRVALGKFAEVDPAAVLLDIGMPEMDGYTVARTIRARFAGHPARIVALTGWGQESDRTRTREAGFDHHLVKPADLRSLEQVLCP